MNAFNINVNRNQQAFNATQNNRRPEMVWQHGQTISAQLESIENGTATLRAEGDVLFTANASDIRGQVGDTLTFNVRRNGSGFALTQVHDSEAVALPRGRATSMDAIKDFTQTMDGIKENNDLRAEMKEEHSQKMAQALAAIRRSQSFMANTNGKSAIAAIVNSGLDLTKVSFAMMDRIMHHIDRTPTPPSSEDAQFTTRENGEHMVSGLRRHGLPVSERNVANMERAWERFPVKISDPAVTYLVSEKTELTLDAVYKSNYAAPKDAIPEEAVETVPAWQAPREAIEKLFAQENIDPTRDNLSAARFLLARDLPITAETVAKVQLLRTLPEKAQDENFREAFFDHSAAFIREDKPLGTLPLSEIVRLVEMQLKAATQAATRHQELHIDTDAMKENLHRLTLQEAEAYVKIAGVPAGKAYEVEEGSASAKQLVTVFDKLVALQPLTANVHAGILHNHVPFTIDAMHDSVLIARANEGYAQNETVPSPRYGDSFAQVKTQFSPLLTEMGIASTDEALKAAFILSKNKIDVTEANLQTVKEIDAKITAITNKLHPMIAATMIKEGLNPLEMHADQVLSYIKQFNYDMGESGAEKISRYIREMDENKAIDGDTRKTMIAIYRMLHVIQKDGAASLGLAMQMNAPLTLGDLLNLAQGRESRKRGGFDTTVNDALGELERVTRPEGNIRQTIAQGITNHALTHMDVVADTFTDNAPPTALEKLIQSAQSMERAIEDLANNETAPTPVNSATATKQLEAFVEANADIIHKLQTRNISTRTGNIKAANEIEKDSRSLESALSKALGEHDGSVPTADLSALRNGNSPAQILAQIRAVLGEEPALDPLRAMLSVTHGYNGDAENGFQIPVRINGRICHLNMYVLNDRALTADGAKIFLSLDTARLGTVSAYFSLNKDVGLDVTISAETPAALTALEAQHNTLLELAQHADVNVSEVRFIHG
ncbi:MAG: flagellar hook-length control protein FliK [Defluviitaleaceae bacterium]|nr:flagellar hook-length control protein FliK [Defluviitaleaceae bacterium]MCL2273791.1 flagellar hook-length control protein FliK [Defluviitaleaceae bacterium]